MLTWVWIVPRGVYSASSLALATWASYAPFILAGLSGGWIALWLRELAFSDEEAIPFRAIAALLALTTLIFTMAGLLTNHLARMLERQRAHERELARRLVELEESRRRIVETQESLKRHVAETLHGGVQNRLVLVSHLIEQASQSLDSGAAKAGEAIDRAKQLVRDVNDNELRQIAKQLHPSIVKIGLVPALKSLATNYPGSAAVELNISAEVEELEQPGGVKLEDGLKLTLYRVAEEALTNAAKHAQASGVEIAVGFQGEDSIRLRVTDQGEGFDASTQTPGFGMLNMMDYAEAGGGELNVESAPHKGTSVTALLPLKFKARPSEPFRGAGA